MKYCQIILAECNYVFINLFISLSAADTDPQRRALIKEKTNKYLSYAEQIYKNHLCDTEQTVSATTPVYCLK